MPPLPLFPITGSMPRVGGQAKPRPADTIRHLLHAPWRPAIVAHIRQRQANSDQPYVCASHIKAILRATTDALVCPREDCKFHQTFVDDDWFETGPMATEARYFSPLDREP